MAVVFEVSVFQKVGNVVKLPQLAMVVVEAGCKAEAEAAGVAVLKSAGIVSGEVAAVAEMPEYSVLASKYRIAKKKSATVKLAVVPKLKLAA